MHRAETIAELRALLRGRRRDGARIAFVPTMGALHDGHLALLDVARAHGDVVVLSIFVNPLQFGPTEDFARYPRDLDGDAAKAERRGVDVLFAPPREEMYPRDRAVEVRPIALADRWEGAVRPGHFAGVLTVVAKLFNIVQPDAAVFGQKDIQQATLIRAMIRDLDVPVEIVVAPTVRDSDGLALSSRNAYLSPDERGRARAIPRALQAIGDAFAQGERDARRLEGRGRAVLESADGIAIEYLALMDPVHLRSVELATPGTIAALAVRVGATRLIDNAILRGP
ncbi:MAG TPA: pantoate--beta-alanine ligase [Gemmatimonadaceae bacterium]|nr:pantoate--beta-alanine ligase [Gemmatimonadaceae bacterium]